MRTVAVTNLKGGVGKTTTTISLGAGMALKGLRVLLVDVDAQGNLATALGLQPRHTLYEVLVDGKEAAQCVTSARANLDLLAADETLLTAQPLMAQRPDWAHLLGRALRSLATRYDVALIDCAASLSVVNAGALLCADDIVVPVVMEHLALRGIELLDRQLRRLGASPIRCIVPTMFDVRQRQAHELMAALRDRHPGRVAAPIRVNVRLSEAPAQGKTIYEYDPRSRGAADYAALVEHLVTLLQLPVPERPERAERIVASLDTRRPVVTPAAPREEAAMHTRSSDVAHEACPTCDRPLQHTVLAGYRVRYCNHCHYHRQELIHGVRR